MHYIHEILKCKILFQVGSFVWLSDIINFPQQKNMHCGYLKTVWSLRRKEKPWERQSSGRQWGVAALINHPCLKSDLCPNRGINIRGALLWFLLWIWPRSIASKRKLCWIITNFICADLLEIRQDRWVAASAHLITPFPDFFPRASFWISLLQCFSSNFGHRIMLEGPIKHRGNVINPSTVSKYPSCTWQTQKQGRLRMIPVRGRYSLCWRQVFFLYLKIIHWIDNWWIPGGSKTWFCLSRGYQVCHYKIIDFVMC
jgi:hypothetical protein